MEKDCIDGGCASGRGREREPESSVLVGPYLVNDGHLTTRIVERAASRQSHSVVTSSGPKMLFWHRRSAPANTDPHRVYNGAGTREISAGSPQPTPVEPRPRAAATAYAALKL